MSAGRDLQRFAEAVARQGSALDHIALLLGDWDYPALDVAQYRRQLDDIAVVVRQAVERQPQLPVARAQAISDVLFSQMRFRGNVDDYYDPRNSFLGQVLDRRLGIPISLSVLFLEVARRVGVLAQGVNFPGHFLVRVADDDSWRFLDAFDGGRLLANAELLAILQRSAGPDATVEPAHLSAASKKQIISRMLLNLAGIYGKHGDLVRSVSVLERLAILDPDNPRLARELAALRSRVDSLN